MRKTLEANMQMANTFPPGRVLWAMRDSDLHPSHRLSAQRQNNGGDRLRLFEVLDAEKVFSQVIFARDMLRCVLLHILTKQSCLKKSLSAHMPHQYDRVLHDLL
jgi:sn1-specific diacylglycerol lipase